MNFLSKCKYFLYGASRRVISRRVCPACDGTEGHKIDSKWVFTLLRCVRCGLLYRFPLEDQESLIRFYQREYKQQRLSTDVPDDETLRRLVETRFCGTYRDVGPVVELFSVLGLQAGLRLLDFGASWGYQTFQFRQQGFDASGYEVSIPRAEAGRRLGLEIRTSLDELGNDFDIVYSNHVLEHVVNPKAFLQRNLSKLRRGGTLICLTPNGSAAFRAKDWRGFHRSWGQVHPVLATEEFVVRNFGHFSGWVGNSSDLDGLRKWDRNCFSVGRTDDAELLIVLIKE